jgi:sugar/nucleoside kinase (ribokinase family)
MGGRLNNHRPKPKVRKLRPARTVRDVIARAGGVRAVVNRCDVAQATVYLWLRSNHVPFLRDALILAKAARVPVSLLAGPESEWQRPAS